MEIRIEIKQMTRYKLDIHCQQFPHVQVQFLGTYPPALQANRVKSS